MLFCTKYDLTRQHRGPFGFFGRLPNSIMVSTVEKFKKNMRKTPIALQVYTHQLCRLI